MPSTTVAVTRRATALAVLLAVASVLVARPASAATTTTTAATATTTSLATGTWAAESQATIHPGVQTVTSGNQCTSNFVFTDGGGDVYLGQAAHCASTGDNTQTDGCDTPSRPLGTPVEVDGARYAGTLVYSSWVTMQARGETDPDTCAYNDLALIRLDRRDHPRVNPTVPFYGGPTGLVDTTRAGDTVYSYGNSSLRFGVTELSPKEGTSLGTSAGGWTHTVYTATPGIPGDSGSGFLDAQGRAFGVLSTVQLAPLPAANGVGDLAHELAYLGAHTSLDVALVLGTRGFDPSPVPVDTGASGSGEPPQDEVRRLAGATRIETAVAVSRDRFADDQAGAVVLSRADAFPDALAGTPLAASLRAPLLLTPPTGLAATTRDEIDRVLPPGGRVYLLGGPVAIAPTVADQLSRRGYDVVRLAGETRIETALAIADRVTTSPAYVFVADGTRFADALVAGPAAYAVRGVVVLTPGASRVAAVDSYLQAHRDAEVVTVGAAATRAYPGRTSHVGATDQATSVQVAQAYLPHTPTVAVARVDLFADALAGGAHVAAVPGPVLLTDRDHLTAAVAEHLRAHASGVHTAFLYGGEQALAPRVADEVRGAISG